MKPRVLEAESTLTDRFQTTVPEPIRRVLQLGKRDRIRYVVRPDGSVTLQRAVADAHEDPVVGEFLAFLARDVQQHPARLQNAGADLVSRIHELVGDVEVDLDATLSPDDE